MAGTRPFRGPGVAMDIGHPPITPAAAGSSGGPRAASPMVRRLFEDAMAAVVATTIYLENQGLTEQRLLEGREAILFTAESLRMTTRLMEVVAWLLAQRAVEAGEITMEEAVGPRFRLGFEGQDFDLVERWNGDETGFAAMPPRFRELVADSHGLYARVGRLERLLAGALVQ